MFSVVLPLNALSPNLFRLVSGICNRLLVFNLRVLVLACLTNKVHISFSGGDLENEIVLQDQIRKADSIYPITVCPKSYVV